MVAPCVYVGCAGWSLPTSAQVQFGPGASHLHRYATRLNACEINSSFHRPHSQSTYRRWAESVPGAFRFCVKMPQTITHERKLLNSEALLYEFLEQAQGLGDRLGSFLVQLPPSLALDRRAAHRFLGALRGRWGGTVALEPRHASWFTPDGDELLRSHEVARVLADPVRHDSGAAPGGWDGAVYLRLHGAPRIYYSSYGPALITALARRIAQALQDGQSVWCIFDNTAGGAAAENALSLRQALARELE